MAFYESIIIIRQDVSSADVDKIVDDLKKIIEEHKGKVVKTEYWGLRSLAYEIKNNKKGHYYFMGIEATKPLLDEIDRKKLSTTRKPNIEQTYCLRVSRSSSSVPNRRIAGPFSITSSSEEFSLKKVAIATSPATKKPARTVVKVPSPSTSPSFAKEFGISNLYHASTKTVVRKTAK